MSEGARRDFGWCAACGKRFRDLLGTREVFYQGRRHRIHNTEYGQFRDTGILRYTDRPRTEMDRSWGERHWKLLAALTMLLLLIAAYSYQRMTLERNPERYFGIIGMIEDSAWLGDARESIIHLYTSLFPRPVTLDQAWYKSIAQKLDKHGVTGQQLRGAVICLVRENRTLDMDDLARCFALVEEYDRFIFMLRNEYGGRSMPYTIDALNEMGLSLYFMKQELEEDPGIDDFLLDQVFEYEFWGDPCIRDGDISRYDIDRHKFVWQNYKDSPFKENWFKPEARFFFTQSMNIRPAEEDYFDLGITKNELIPLTSSIEKEGMAPVTVEELESYKREAQMIWQEALEKYPDNLSLAEAYTALRIRTERGVGLSQKLNALGIINAVGNPLKISVDIPQDKMVPGGETYKEYPHLDPKYNHEFVHNPEDYFSEEKQWIYFDSMDNMFSTFKARKKFVSWLAQWKEPSIISFLYSTHVPPWNSFYDVPAREEFILDGL